MARNAGFLNNLKLFRKKDGYKEALKKIEETGKTGATALNLNFMELTEIPPEIAQLKNLTKLIIGNNQLTELPPEIAQLKNLITFSIGGNQLTKIPPEIAKLKNLTELNIGDNRLTEIPPKIAQLRNLAALDIANNQITSIPPWVLETGLEIVIKKPYWDFNKGINLYGNPLVDPPVEIVMQGNDAIANYFAEKERHGSVELFEAKLLVVGAGGVGKSWLLHRLVHDEIDKSKVSTEGIDIHTWQVETARSKDFRVNFWDFGGQQIYYATHQFFMTSSSLYLFLWAARSDDDALVFDYWLNAIKNFSDNSPLLVVQSKCDERTKEINQVKYKRGFDNITGFYNVSAKEDTGIDELRSVIAQELDKLPHIGKKLPKNWVAIRQELEKLPENYIDYRNYLEICKSHQTAPKQARYLSEDFHTLGTFLHFRKNPALKHWLFLKPEWVTKAVYIVNDDKVVQKNHGYFTREQCPEIWRDHTLYPPEIHDELIELMKSFELCFELPGGDAYILPELLRTEEPEEYWDEKPDLAFQYQFDFMIKGLMTYLTVSLHELILDNLFWKDGLVVAYENAKARIRTSTRMIEINVQGESPSHLLAIIRHKLDEILKRYKHLEVTRKIPCICPECRTQVKQDGKHFFKYNIVQNLLNKNRDEMICDLSGEDVSIAELLEGVGESIPRPKPDQPGHTGQEPTGPRTLKIFIASGSDTKEERKELHLYLLTLSSNLKSQGVEIKPVLWEYQDHSISLAERKQDDFNRELLQCDMAICIFKAKVGQYTKEELDVAWENLQAGKKPQHLYVYFYAGSFNEQEAENYAPVKELKKEIEKKEQIYCKYKNIDNLKNQVHHQLNLVIEKSEEPDAL